jgi:D-alanyl-D-alanine carboxypeptidase (penicillin-binding protein 5/6)
MIALARRGVCKLMALVVSVTFAVAAMSGPAAAQGLFSQPRYAAIVVDASSGEVLYSKRADALRYPASITKIMTLYLTFEALSTGRLKLTDRVPVSEHAYNMIPSKSSLRPGESLSVDEAMRIVAVHSANDIAVALAEKIGGSESRFASLMTLRAQELGMANTRFVNANGVPDSRQLTTARDIAILSRAVLRDYPQYFDYFGLRDCVVAGKFYANHNHLLREPGYDGFKTGFTNAAGYNLSASAVRDGHRLITVVLGGSSGALRDETVMTLMNAGFDVLKKRSLGVKTTIAQNIDVPDDTGPIQPGVEEGDGGRGELRAEVVDPVHGVVHDQLSEEEQKLNMPVAAPPPPGLRGRVTTAAVAHAAAPCVAPARHGRHAHKAAACAKSAAVEVAAADCSHKHGKAKRLCESSAAKSEKSEKTEVAAADCAKKHGKAKQTCERTEETASAKPAHGKTAAHQGRHHHVYG